MDAYIYQAALLCDDCALKVIEDLKAKGVADAGDSDGYPQGPYGDGGGESDLPEHCAHCNEFLENPLTSEGMAWLKEALASEHGKPEIKELWADFYELDYPPVQKWVVGSNMPGYMPDNENYLADDYEDAIMAMISEMEMDLDQLNADSDEESDDKTALEEAIDAMSCHLDRFRDGKASESEQGLTVGNRHYFVAHAVD